MITVLQRKQKKKKKKEMEGERKPNHLPRIGKGGENSASQRKREFTRALYALGKGTVEEDEIRREKGKRKRRDLFEKRKG